MPSEKPVSAFPMALKIRKDLQKLNLVSTSGETPEITFSLGMNCLRENDRLTTQQELMSGCLESLKEASGQEGNHIVLYGIEGNSPR